SRAPRPQASSDRKDQKMTRLRYALVGSGSRAQMYLDALATTHADVAELVAWTDTNPGRQDWSLAQHPELGTPARFAPDALADVVVEKPLTIDEAGVRRIAEAAERTGREVTITFNYRYSPRNSALKQLIDSGEIGSVTSVHFEWVLDTAHGADYFRRWHRDKD